MTVGRLAIVREVSESLPDCELTFLPRDPIDVGRARLQHAAYVQTLEECGYSVTVLPAQHAMPDAVFVEDTMVVLDECAIVMNPGAEKRRKEIPSLAAEVEKHRPLLSLALPGTMDGGDVLRVGRTLYVGRSLRTNDDGISQLRRLVATFRYQVKPVDLTDCLHLKSGCTFVGKHILIHEAWIDPAPFEGLPLLQVPASEPFGANALLLGDRVVVSASYPETERLLTTQGYQAQRADISELEKAEAALTCMSLLL